MAFDKNKNDPEKLAEMLIDDFNKKIKNAKKQSVSDDDGLPLEFHVEKPSKDFKNKHSFDDFIKKEIEKSARAFSDEEDIEEIEVKDDVLKKICEDKLKHVEKQQTIVSAEVLTARIEHSKPPRKFLESIKEMVAKKQNALIAEIKKASPSRGVIRADFDPADLAEAYANGGATCLSVLTDMPYFQGRDENIEIAKRACALPALRKDFILDVYQVLEARAIGADCILLIMAALSDKQAAELEKAAIALDMDVLVEVHNENELERALKLKTRLIGINNRDLRTLKIDLSTTERLAPMLPKDYVVVCESGISTPDDIARMNKIGVYTFLVGESLMKQSDVEQATKNLLSI